MPLFARHDPSLRELIAYLVARSLERDVTLTQTKLVKLLYLIDLRRLEQRRAPLTGLRWRFFHYGPYALELPETLEPMEGTEVIVKKRGEVALYIAAPGAPDGDDWERPARTLADDVVRRFAPMDLNELLDYVYFRTGPMRDAQRGDELDLSLPGPPRSKPALKPPAASADLTEKVRAWRTERAAGPARVPVEPPVHDFDDPGDDLDAVGLRGTLHIPEDAAI